MLLDHSKSSIYDSSLANPAPPSQPIHKVQFYEDGEYLSNSVSTYVSSGLRAGEGIILIIEDDHFQSIQKHLVLANIDTEKAILSGQLLILNASDTLEQFMIDGIPDPELFESRIGEILEKMSRSFPVIRAYGEMVNILLTERNLEGTLALEKLWNKLAQTRSFSLLCGYVMDNFKEEKASHALDRVCDEHSHIIPAESYGGLSNDQLQLRLITELQQKTMALQTEIAERKSIEVALRKSEEDLRRAKEAADAANLAKSRFVANMSHEIRTPLGAMLGFADLMLDPHQNEEERAECIETIISNGRYLTRIINDILDISKVESEQLQIEKVEFSLVELISDVSSLMGLMAREKGLILHTDVDASIPKNIVSDPTRLRQILVNVIGNAIKFTERGNIKIITRMKELGSSANSSSRRTLEFIIRDTEIGLNANQAESLFEPFIQADSSISRKYGGSGLGLYLSRKFAQALGGDLILAESCLGAGSTFILTTDLHAMDSVSQIPFFSSQTHPVVYRFDEKRFLVVDDSEENRIFLTRLLQKAGAVVDVAEDGQIGLKRALVENYDAILLDIQMPVLDGFDVIRELRKADFQKPVIALTAHVMKSDQENCIRAGFSDHLESLFIVLSCLKY